jgi:hypothetical protein
MSYLKTLLSSIAGLCLLLQISVALADDIVPPPWARGEPFTTVQEWEFDTPGAIAPDGDSVPLFNPGGPPMAMPGPDLAHFPPGVSPFSGLSGYVGTGGPGSVIGFDIPNIPDDFPIKHLHIQINGAWEIGLEPFVSLVIGEKADFPPLPGGIVGSEETFPGFHRVESWDIMPNPDFEFIEIFIPGGSFVNQVVIDTISMVPVPAALPLLLSALGMAGFMSRRRVS